MRFAFMFPLLVSACATVSPDAPPARLAVTSEPAGALAVLSFRSGAAPQACTTPCGFVVPPASSFHVGFVLDGYRLASVTQPRWDVSDRDAPVLAPDTAHAVLTPR